MNQTNAKRPSLSHKFAYVLDRPSRRDRIIMDDKESRIYHRIASRLANSERSDSNAVANPTVRSLFVFESWQAPHAQPRASHSPQRTESNSPNPWPCRRTRYHLFHLPVKIRVIDMALSSLLRSRFREVF